MNWDAIGAIGEIIGALAVVVSLLYLAIQVRTQNRETRLAAMHDITVGYRDCLTTFTSREITELIVKANENFESLSDAEQMQIIAAAQRVLRVGEEAFIQYEEGRLDERMWAPIARTYATYMSIPAFDRIWQLRKENYDERFALFLDGASPTDRTLR